MRLLPQLHPITRKRLRRFRSLRRAWWSFWILAIGYALSLFSEFIANDRPIAARVNGRVFFPVWRIHSERAVTGQGGDAPMDWKALRVSPSFAQASGNFMVFPPIPYGPYEIIAAQHIAAAPGVELTFAPRRRVGSVDVDTAGVIRDAQAAEHFLGVPDREAAGRKLSERWTLPPSIQAAVAARLRNEPVAGASADATSAAGLHAQVSVSPAKPLPQAPAAARVIFRETVDVTAATASMRLGDDFKPAGPAAPVWAQLADSDRAAIAVRAQVCAQSGAAEPIEVVVAGRPQRVMFFKEIVRYPFRPCAGHPLGIDGAGRDVLARLIYGFRTSMTFGMILVIVATVVGTIIGGLQGYYAGWVDVTGQRLIEVWAAIPFLYVIILLGSVYGQSFLLLLLVDAVFGWVGISYYMRAEFLRLRRWPFVEAAKSLGLSGWTIMFRHILPNALVPIITFFAFNLVGAISLLAALDYLGFGLPAPTPSWGELLNQGHEFGWAWWLIVYPAVALFLTMLFTVFVGEGLRAAFDPRVHSRME